MTAPQTGIQRQHELDALRAFAMFLGIALHGALSFAPGFPWIVRDHEASSEFTWMYWAIHGFRMPLFMLISGYFTMMLYRRKGLASLVKQRAYRVLLPFLLSLVTILPLLIIAIFAAFSIGRSQGMFAKQVNAGSVASAEIVGEKPSSEPAIFDYNLQEGADASFADHSLPSSIGSLQGNRNNAPSSDLASIGDLESIRKQYQDFLQSPRFQLPFSWMGGASIFDVEILIHLWFLCHLCWLNLFFALIALLFSLVRVPRLPPVLLLSPLRWCWILPLTLLPQLFMGIGHQTIGPDTSASFLPKPHVLFYYAVFFFFGALYYDVNDRFGRLGKWWWIELPVALFVVLPLAVFAFDRNWMPPFLAERLPLGGDLLERVVISGILQVIYVWLMSFGMIGLFRAFMSHETPAIRYLSDASYWFYLAHLTPMVVIQALVCHWAISPWIKFAFVCGLTCFIMFVTYEYLVRYSWVGRLLNGPRTRPSERIDIDSIGESELSNNPYRSGICPFWNGPSGTAGANIR